MREGCMIGGCKYADITRIFLQVAFTMLDYEGLGLLHEIFKRQAKKTPDSIALVCEGGK